MLSFNPSTLALLVVAAVGVRGSMVDERDRSDAKSASSARVLADTTGRPSPPPRADKAAVTITKAADGLFYLDGTVNGAPVRFLLDTGANMMVLTGDDARRVGALGSPYLTGRIQTASGSSAMDRVTLHKVAIGRDEAANVDAAVMRDGLAVSLLGQNMLSKLGRITMSNDTITIEQRR